MYNSHKPRKESAKIFILKSLIPYTEANMMLAFKPGLFFSELEKISRHKRRALEVAMREAERQKLIELKVKQDQNIVRLTELGQKVVRPFVAKRLGNDAKLMIIFDVPEDMAYARARLRRVLRSWNFKPTQKSVWITSYDHKQSVNELVKELDIESYTQLFECAPIKP